MNRFLVTRERQKGKGILESLDKRDQRSLHETQRFPRTFITGLEFRQELNNTNININITVF